MKKEGISIIIPTLNEEKNLPNLLEDLLCQTYKNFEVIIVDSNSKDKTLKVAKKYSKKIKIRTFQLGFAKGPSYGRNKGAEMAKYDELLFLDADTRIQKDFLEKMIKIKKEKKIDVAAFYFKIPKESKFLVKVGLILNNFGLFLSQFVRPAATGACMASRKEIHKKIKGFNTKIILCEDCDYARRAAKISKFGIIKVPYIFNERRLEKEGPIKVQMKYLKENILSIFRNPEKQKVDYKFGDYN